MDLLSTLTRSLLEGYATSELTISTVFTCVILTTLIAAYIFIVYRCVNRNTFYNRNLALSLVCIAVITSAVILTIQSNIVVSLGMVGALSIVRFRTAIKDPMDLIFLFWSISAGIICGAGFAMIAIVTSIALTIIIILVSILPSERESMVLVVDSGVNNERQIMETVSRRCWYSKIRARNVSPERVNLAIEVKTTHPHDLVQSVTQLEHITSVSLVEHDGDITA